MPSPLIVCMGVSGSGKSTLATEIARHFGLPFIEADALHGEQNIEKMRSGIPLTDADRAPWMARVCQRVSQSNTASVLAHSGLRRRHRDMLRLCATKTLFLHLCAPMELIEERLRQRSNHFMPTHLLQSQFDSLQGTEAEEDVIELNLALAVREQLQLLETEIRAFLTTT